MIKSFLGSIEILGNLMIPLGKKEIENLKKHN